MLQVRLTVAARLLQGEHRARLRLARGVAYHRGEVADNQHDLMPQILKLAHLAQHYSKTDVDVGAGRVDAQLDAEGSPLLLGALELFLQAPFGDDLFRAARELGHGFVDAWPTNCRVTHPENLFSIYCICLEFEIHSAPTAPPFSVSL